ncbi:MAG: hypothetical protein F4Y03_00565 [Alphaproteobacteria bacterium]|nr:hypothetical protein [Alphaproteobacteria bacterium]
MSPELIAIIAVGATLAGIMITTLRDLRRDLNARIDGVNARIDSIEERLRSVEAGLAEIRGQLSIVRDYIAGRNARAGDPPIAPAE